MTVEVGTSVGDGAGVSVGVAVGTGVSVGGGVSVATGVIVGGGGPMAVGVAVAVGVGVGVGVRLGVNVDVGVLVEVLVREGGGGAVGAVAVALGVNVGVALLEPGGAVAVTDGDGDAVGSADTSAVGLAGRGVKVGIGACVGVSPVFGAVGGSLKQAIPDSAINRSVPTSHRRGQSLQCTRSPVGFCLRRVTIGPDSSIRPARPAAIAFVAARLADGERADAAYARSGPGP